MLKQIIAIDVETTGLKKGLDDFVQLAAYGEDFVFNSWAVPEVTVDPGAREVHGHTWESLSQAGHRPSGQVAIELAEKLNTRSYILAGHNLPFDLGILSRHQSLYFLQNVPRICTYQAALRLVSGTDNNQLMSIFHHLVGEPDFEVKPHDAASDARCSWHIAQALCAMTGRTPESMAKWLSTPMELERWPSGEKKGTRFDDLDASFLRWVLAKDFPVDVAYSCSQALKRMTA